MTKSKLIPTQGLKIVSLSAMAILLASSAHSFADKGGKGGGKGKKGGKAKVEKSDFKIDSKDLKKDLKKLDYKGNDDFYSYYKKGGKKDLPHGLQKKLASGKGLPEGWKNKVKPGWKIDNDYWGRMSLLDKDDLPPNFKMKDGVGAYLLGDRVLRVNKDTKTVIDFVDLVTD